MKYITYVPIKKKNFFWTIIRYIRFFISFTSIYINKINKKTKKYNCSICAIFKNEAPFLKEWMEYHLLIGIDHFYLYNNFSDDNYNEILLPYIEKGVIDLIDWPVQYGQLQAYKHCYETYKNDTEWIGYIDLDEFVCLKYEQNIKDWIKGYKKYPSVLINWKFFGTSGRLQHDPDRLVIEQYTASWSHLVNTGKSFINTAYRFEVFTCHTFYAETSLVGIKTKILPVNEFKRFFHYWIPRTPLHAESKIQINHYYTRSYQQHIYKNMLRGDACSAGSQQERIAEGRFEAHETKNINKDYTIQRFLVFLKLRLEK